MAKACRHRNTFYLGEIVTGKNIKPYRLWTCDSCGKRDRWGKTWAYYGSMGCLKCHQEPAIDFVVCSDACRVEMERRPRVPLTEREAAAASLDRSVRTR